MKNCAHFKQDIMLFAYGELDAKKAAPLTEHMAGCPACQKLFNEITATLETAQNLTAPEQAASLLEDLEDTVLEQLKTAAPHYRLRFETPWWRVLLSPRVAVPVLSACIIAITFVFWPHPASINAIEEDLIILAQLDDTTIQTSSSAQDNEDTDIDSILFSENASSDDIELLLEELLILEAMEEEIPEGFTRSTPLRVMRG